MQLGEIQLLIRDVFFSRFWGGFFALPVYYHFNEGFKASVEFFTLKSAETTIQAVRSCNMCFTGFF